MTDFLLELLTEEIPARMQARAVEQLRNRLSDGLRTSGLSDQSFEALAPRVGSYVTPRRLVAFVDNVATKSKETEHEFRGPRVGAPEPAIAGFLKSVGITRDELQVRAEKKGDIFFAVKVIPGRPAAAILAELIPAIVRDFDWPKSMRWGAASSSTASPRWVRPLAGIVALLDDAVVPLKAAGIASGRTTYGHRFMSSGAIEIISAATYPEQLRAAHVMLDASERAAVIVAGAEAAATAAGLRLIPDAGLVAENAGLTEWPVPLLGRFDPAFLDVPREIIQLTMRTNQKYFACTDGVGDSGGALAPAFVCVANLAAADGGAAIVAGNQKVLAARLSDAKFFWDADLASVRDGGLASFTPKLADIVFHEKLGTVADKVERVAKLARWLVESGAVRGADPRLAETAARLCKADLVSATVGEFPEVQGIAGGHLAAAEELDAQVAAAIGDHYKPVGPSDGVPTAPVTVVVAMADKLDTLAAFFTIDERPTGSKDPFALRRAALGLIRIVLENGLRPNLLPSLIYACAELHFRKQRSPFKRVLPAVFEYEAISRKLVSERELTRLLKAAVVDANEDATSFMKEADQDGRILFAFLADRLKVQQREAGIRPDVIDAVFSLGGEDDLVRLVARAKALQAVLATPDGASLLAGYRRGANIVRIEEAKEPGVGDGELDATRLTEPAEVALNAALDAAVPEAAGAVAGEDFTGAMTALARLRPAVDAFFEHVTVNAHEADVRRNRLALLARLRTAVHSVADFSKLEG